MQSGIQVAVIVVSSLFTERSPIFKKSPLGFTGIFFFMDSFRGCGDN